MRKIGLREILLSSGSGGLKALKLCDYILGSMAARLVPAEIPMEIPSAVSRILIIRPGGIGDAVFLLPILKSVKLKNPQVCIDVLCQKRNSSVFSSQGNLVDHVYDSLADLRILRKNAYDIVVDTEQWHYLTALTSRQIKPHVKIGFATRPLRRKLVNVAVNYDANAYELENFSRLFESLMEVPGSKRELNGCFYLSEETKAWASLQIPANSVTIAIGASVPERRLGADQLAALAQGLVRRGLCPVFLGGKDVLPLSRQLMVCLGGTLAYSFVGTASLQESAALIKASRLFIGTDSGLMHLAAAVGSPVIAIFGAGNMKKWNSPKEGDVGINENLPCSPCTAFGYGLPICHGAFQCIRKMDMESMLDQYLHLEGKNV